MKTYSCVVETLIFLRRIVLGANVDKLDRTVLFIPLSQHVHLKKMRRATELQESCKIFTPSNEHQLLNLISNMSSL